MGRTDSKPQLPKSLWRLVKHGDTFNEYGNDPVRIVGAIVGIAVEHGMPVAWVERLLTNPANRAAYYVRTAGNPDGRVKLADVRRWYERSGSAELRRFDLDEWRDELRELRELATSSAWPAWIEYKPAPDAAVVRVKGGNVRRVLAAHLRLSSDPSSSGIDYPASDRKVAELSNVGDVAARKATAALVALRVLSRRKPPGKRDAFTATHYRVDASGVALRRIVGDVSPELADLAALECHPIWRHGSGVRFDVWAQVVTCDGSATVASIADETTASRVTVRRVLAALERLQLVEGLDDGTVRPLTVDHRAALDAAALESGMADRARRQLERHDADRAAHVETVVRKGGRMLAAAMRRGVSAVLAAMREYVNLETGEIVAVSVEREQHPADVDVGTNRQHAPPLLEAVA